jgi:hypothetical protein
VVAFIGISYWDQTMVQWYALLAMISAAITIPKKELSRVVLDVREPSSDLAPKFAEEMAGR